MNDENKKLVAAIFVAGLVACFSIILVYSLINTQNSNFSPSNRKSTSTSTSKSVITPLPTSTPFPTPTLIPLLQGPITYSISMNGIPKMHEVWFNTIDPKKGTQEVKLKVSDDSGKVNSATALVKTENVSKKYSLSLVSETGSETVWGGSWQISDTYNRNFVITFSVADDKGNKSSNDLTIR